MLYLTKSHAVALIPTNFKLTKVVGFLVSKINDLISDIGFKRPKVKAFTPVSHRIYF